MVGGVVGEAVRGDEGHSVEAGAVAWRLGLMERAENVGAAQAGQTGRQWIEVAIHGGEPDKCVGVAVCDGLLRRLEKFSNIVGKSFRFRSLFAQQR